jgi:hypothetical protein
MACLASLISWTGAPEQADSMMSMQAAIVILM